MLSDIGYVRTLAALQFSELPSRQVQLDMCKTAKETLSMRLIFLARTSELRGSA